MSGREASVGERADSFVASLRSEDPVAAERVAVNGLAARVSRVAAPVREQVLELLRKEIVEMRLRPGQRLVERELIDSFGVSRTTIREALRGLAAEGLVTTIPQKGAIVAIPSAKAAAEVYEVRALLEGAAAREFVGALVHGVAGVTLHPVPAHLVMAERGV